MLQNNTSLVITMIALFLAAAFMFRENLTKCVAFFLILFFGLSVIDNSNNANKEIQELKATVTSLSNPTKNSPVPETPVTPADAQLEMARECSKKLYAAMADLNAMNIGRARANIDEAYFLCNKVGGLPATMESIRQWQLEIAKAEKALKPLNLSRKL